MAITAAPSWAESTLQWIKENCPQYLGARGDPVRRLGHALAKASYLLEEAGHDRAVHAALLATEVGDWDLTRHNRFRTWIGAGGYKAPAHLPAGANPATGIPPMIVNGPNGPEAINIVMDDEKTLETLQPPAEHTQSLEDVLAEEQLNDDERFGAW